MNPNPSTGREKEPVPSRDVQLMSAGSQSFGLLAAEIEGVTDWQNPAPLPNAPASVLGVVSIRGRVFTVLSAVVLLGEEAGISSKIVRLRGDEQIALAVDHAGEVLELTPAELPASKEAQPNSLILGVVSRGDQTIKILDHTQIFATAMRGRERRQRHF